MKDTMAAGMFDALEEEIEDAGMNIKMSEKELENVNIVYEATYIHKKKFNKKIKDLEVITSPSKLTLVVCTDEELSCYDLDTLE